MGFSIDPLSLILGLVFGLVLGGGTIWLVLRSSGAQVSAHAKAAIEQERSILAERLSAEFRKLSTDALGQNNRQFLDLARTQFDGFQAAAKGDIGLMLQPVKESLAKVDKQISDIEKERVGAYRGLSVQVEEMAKHHLRLGSETQKLVNAMRSPGIRGRWGELQLRRVIELAGMQAHVDFAEQESFASEDGRQRPDVIVKLPGGRTIVIDSKVPFDHYFEAVGDQGDDVAGGDARRRDALDRHAKTVRNHMSDLGRKAYWAQFDPSPDFVVMFLPDEGFFSAALQSDPTLVEAGLQNHVVPATPTTLIALLRAVEFGWRQEALAENAKDISQNAAELYKRLAKFGEHFQNVGKGLTRAIGSYNDAVGSMERQVLPSARKLKELRAAHDSVEMPDQTMIDIAARPVSAPELLAQPDLLELEKTELDE